MTKPAIYMDSDPGVHNANTEATKSRLIKGGTYKDVSTVIVVPTRGMIPARVAQSWMSLMNPMNQKVTRFVIEQMEVGEAYSHAVDLILNNPELSTWKYMLTLEEDNVVPPDALLKLIESMEDGQYAAVGALYHTKGEMGQPMCYGKVEPGKAIDFIPWLPEPDTVSECQGLGMGCTLFRIDMFKDDRIERPLFQTVQEYTPGVGAKAFTQDLKFFDKVRRLGYRVACDSRVRVGHLDIGTGIVW